jgi:glycopeptide antibiotics resistance protein
MERKGKIRLFFGVYCLLMLWLLFGRQEAPAGLPYSQQLLMRLNLVPFRTLGLQLRLLTDVDRPWLIRHSLINLGGNILLFIPLGLFLPKLWQKLNSFPRMLLTTAGIITAVEITQLMTLLGRCDVDDLILNITGAAIGYWIYKRSCNNLLSN